MTALPAIGTGYVTLGLARRAARASQRRCAGRTARRLLAAMAAPALVAALAAFLTAGGQFRGW